MIELPKSSEMGKKGTWKEMRAVDVRHVFVSCPGCGQSASMSDHTIAADGTVTPSVVCPFECGFHDMVRLRDWR